MQSDTLNRPDHLAETAPVIGQLPSGNADESREGSPGDLHTTIDQMQALIRQAQETPQSTMQTLEQVQDQLIASLETLNARIENYIEILAHHRK